MAAQRDRSRHPVRIWEWLCAGALLAACGDDEGSRFTSPTATAPEPTPVAYTSRPLVSDGSVPTPAFDRQLVDPWSVVIAPGSGAWITNAATGTATLYAGEQLSTPQQSIALPGGINGSAAPTGAVFNTTTDFVVTDGVISAPASLIFSGQGGTILAWAPSVDQTTAFVAYDDGNGGARYTGLALASSAGANLLYAADFHNGKIDVFDGEFQKIGVPGDFQDPELPAGYAPFGIQALPSGNDGETVLVVSYARRAPDSDQTVNGGGLGLLNVFDTRGALVSHFVRPGGRLNAPWGMALAPEGFGALKNTLLVGNSGDGVINAFDPATGEFIDSVRDAGGRPIATPGLRGIVFGREAQNPSTDTLFFVASLANGAGGLYGRIDPVASAGSGQAPAIPPPSGGDDDVVLSSRPIIGVPFDSTPPTVHITLPGPNAIASDIITVLATATDNTAVVSVEFFVGFTSIGFATGPPFFVDWDTRSVANGTVTLVARATDVAGNVAASQPITLRISNVPRAPPR
ncbi:MAG: TIGR03118 family protein [Steroidobacteraceae bacterium]|nr:TIGR03118 family protein [Steroidobacteraceae bacterium]